MTMPEHVARLIRERDLCVLATSRGDLPHASLMSYAYEPDLAYMYMATPASSRKWANLRANPSMALLIDEREKALSGPRAEARAVTVGAELVRVKNEHEKLRIIHLLVSRHPHLEEFFQTPNIEVIRCRPLWCLLLTGAEKSEFHEVKINREIA